jgi:hypothetical protein
MRLPSVWSGIRKLSTLAVTSATHVKWPLAVVSGSPRARRLRQRTKTGVIGDHQSQEPRLGVIYDNAASSDDCLRVAKIRLDSAESGCREHFLPVGRTLPGGFFPLQAVAAAELDLRPLAARAFTPIPDSENAPKAVSFDVAADGRSFIVAEIDWRGHDSANGPDPELAGTAA